MRAIVAVTSDWAIGYKGQLLIRNKSDMKHFVAHTTDGTVIMGRTTLESFPGASPLPRRRNIVLTRDMSYAPEGVEVVHSIEQALAAVRDDDPQTVWCLGGQSIYEQLLPHCSEVIVTKHACQRPADAWFVNLDADPTWQLVDTEPGGITDEGIEFRFLTYRKR